MAVLDRTRDAACSVAALWLLSGCCSVAALWLLSGCPVSSVLCSGSLEVCVGVWAATPPHTQRDAIKEILAESIASDEHLAKAPIKLRRLKQEELLRVARSTED